MARIDGRATPEGTERAWVAHQARHGLPARHVRRGPDGHRLGSIGLGTYLGRPDAATDRAVEEAVRLVLDSGRANVVDTAINYRLQRAERSVGRALASLAAAGRLDRSAIFLSTKAGYLAPDGESPAGPAAWLRAEILGTARIDPSEIVGGSHCMSPRYLHDQVARSRENLGVATIDLVYLHNAPEAQREAVGAEEFDRRLGAAFGAFEAMRRDGTIGAYGLATWDSLRAAPDAPGYLSLARALEIARDVGGAAHGLRYLQFPFNVAMPEAATRRNQPIGASDRTLFEAATELGLGCFTSVPLLQGELARSGPHFGRESRTVSALQFARSAPGTIGALVGAKGPEHLSEDLAVAALEPWSPAEFAARLPRG